MAWRCVVGLRPSHSDTLPSPSYGAADRVRVGAGHHAAAAAAAAAAATAAAAAAAVALDAAAVVAAELAYVVPPRVGLAVRPSDPAAAAISGGGGLSGIKLSEKRLRLTPALLAVLPAAVRARAGAPVAVVLNAAAAAAAADDEGAAGPGGPSGLRPRDPAAATESPAWSAESDTLWL